MEQLSPDVELTQRIRAFVERYANVSPRWLDGDDVEDKYTGPDPYQLLDAASRIESGHTVERCWSDWGSGCYGPYTDLFGRLEHNELLIMINKYSRK